MYVYYEYGAICFCIRLSCHSQFDSVFSLLCLWIRCLWREYHTQNYFFFSYHLHVPISQSQQTRITFTDWKLSRIQSRWFMEYRKKVGCPNCQIRANLIDVMTHDTSVHIQVSRERNRKVGWMKSDTGK